MIHDISSHERVSEFDIAEKIKVHKLGVLCIRDSNSTGVSLGHIRLKLIS